MLKKIFFTILFILLGFILVSYLFPKEITVQRTKAISHHQLKVFQMINHLPNWEKWSPWIEIDPTTKITYGKILEGRGAWYAWESDHPEVGRGKQSITESNSPNYVKTKLQFEDWGTSYAEFQIDEIDENLTQLTWIYHADSGYNPLKRYFNLFLDPMLGEMFEKGLDNIEIYFTKKQSESTDTLAPSDPL